MKIRKIIIINVLIIMFVLIISELLCFHCAYLSLLELDRSLGGTGNVSLKYSSTLMDGDYIYAERSDEKRNNPISEDYQKGSIILFGCSFVYGTNFDSVKDTLSYKLEKMTNRAVYNRGVPAGGVQHMYDQLYRKGVLNEINTKPEYVFYLFVPSLHKERLHLYTYQLVDHYIGIEYERDQYGNFKYKKRVLPKLINGLYIVRYINHYFDYKKLEASSKEYNEEMTSLIKYSADKVKELNPNVKFIVLNIEINELNENDKIERKYLFDDLNKYGIEILDLDKISGIDFSKKEYTESESDFHPKREYWDIVIPKIVEELSL